MSLVHAMMRVTLTPVRFDAFRSIFPAGTVSGAPKIKAVELIYSLERERRGVYAGAVGRFDFANDEMDTCIAIRTMTFKDQVVYLQAGGGSVFDSVEEDEYVETLNKLNGNLKALEDAEREFYSRHFVDALTRSDRILVCHPARDLQGTILTKYFSWMVTLTLLRSRIMYMYACCGSFRVPYLLSLQCSGHQLSIPRCGCSRRLPVWDTSQSADPHSNRQCR